MRGVDEWLRRAKSGPVIRSAFPLLPEVLMEPFVRPGDQRPRDRLNRLEPRNIFRDPTVLLRAVPGLAEQFRTVVPESRLNAATDPVTGLTGVRVLCAECGTESAIVETGAFVECGCGTTYLNTGVSVRVGRFNVEEDF